MGVGCITSAVSDMMVSHLDMSDVTVGWVKTCTLPMGAKDCTGDRIACVLGDSVPAWLD